MLAMARRDDLPVAPAPLGEWENDAACRAVMNVDFYPDLDNGDDPSPALAVCVRCPVTSQCLAYANATGQQWGIWGGTTEYDRGKPRPKRRRVAETASSRRSTNVVSIRPACPSCLSQDVVVPYDPSHLSCVVCRIVWPAPIR